MGAALVRSFKLRLREDYGRVVPSPAAQGVAPLTLRAERARRAIALAAPLCAALEAFEPGVRVRALSVHLDVPRVLATLDPTVPDADPRGRVVRLDGASAAALDAVLAAGAPLVAYLDELVRARVSS